MGAELDGVQPDGHGSLFQVVEKPGEGTEVAGGFDAAGEGHVIGGLIFPLGHEAGDFGAAIAGPFIHGLEELLLGERGVGGQGIGLHVVPVILHGGVAGEQAAAFGDAGAEVGELGGTGGVPVGQRAVDEIDAHIQCGGRDGEGDQELLAVLNFQWPPPLL